MKTRSIGAALAIALLAGCTSTPVVPLPGDGVAADAAFELRIHTGTPSVHADDAITIEAQLAFRGPAPQVTVSGGSTLVAFGLEKVDGNLHMEPVSDLMCVRHDIALGTPIMFPFAKSGGFDNADPAAAFWRAYFADRGPLRLPAGKWKIAALADLFEGADCRGPAHHLEASVTIDVLP